jgi:threonine synthase
MKLYSTKHTAPDVDLKEAVLKGLPPDNGLYMPYVIEPLPPSFWQALPDMTFNEMAIAVANHLMQGFVPKRDLEGIIARAYDFEAPLVTLAPGTHILELFQGPTLAFKDFGGRFMGQLMGYFLRGENNEVNILVATSGDTGSAVAHGFYRVPGIHVTILYPKGKVSDIQERQFTTLGHNITAIEIDGVFDDCQQLVKEAFLDKDLNEKLTLSSANSINIARLIPQSFYYIWAYKQLFNKQLPLYFSVPSGNFGNITAGLLAWRMGLPVTRMIASTNANDIFTQYWLSGDFNPQPSVSTISNAMDVGNPSNFVRILDLYKGNREAMKHDIAAYSFDDTATATTIKEVYQKYHYLICPHTAVGYLGLQAFLNEGHTPGNGIVLATAHPVKFGEIVEPIIGKPIAIPERLQQVIQGEKQSFAMGNSFKTFKAWLLENRA